MTSAQFVERIKAAYGENADSVLAAYPHDTAAAAFKATKDIFRDAEIAWHTWTWARLQAKHGRGQAFVYYFDHRPAKFPDGADHAMDLGYVFGNLDKDRRQLVAPDDWSMSRTMMSYWINFARTGNPNGTGLAPWQPYSTARPELLHLTLDPRMAPVPHMDKLQVLDAHFQRRRELARRL
ncbi:Para-nitrobenzyl esterase [compost metagenome]